MKLTPQLVQFIAKQNKKYCKQLGLESPLYLFTDLELSGMVESHKQFKSIRDGVIGESWHHKDTKLDYDIVYINVDSSDFLWQLVDGVVHELVHLKYPNLRHGSKYQNTVNEVMML